MKLKITEEELITFVSANVLCAIDGELLNFDFDKLNFSADYDAKDKRYWLKLTETKGNDEKVLGSLGVPLGNIKTERDKLHLLIETAGVLLEILKNMNPKPVLHVIKGGLDGTK